MATPTQEEFIRSLSLAVRPGILRPPVLTDAGRDTPLPISNPAEPPHYQPVTRAMALFMANFLLIGWVSALHLAREPSLHDRENAAVIALQQTLPQLEKVRAAQNAAEIVNTRVAGRSQMDAAMTVAAADIAPAAMAPRDADAAADIERALNPGSKLSMQERRKLLDAINSRQPLAYELQLANDLMATGTVPARASQGERLQASPQTGGQIDRSQVRRVDVNMDKPPLRGSL